MSDFVEQESVQLDNSDFVNANVISIRLDTEKPLQKIEFFLRGKEPNSVICEDGVTRTKLFDFGKSKANKRGIQSLLNMCRAIINPQTVQGNYKEDFYLQTIKETRINIAMACFMHRYDWGLESDFAIDEIPDFIMYFVEPFLSRTIGNKERESYSQSIQAKEISTNSGGKMFNFLGNK